MNFLKFKNKIIHLVAKGGRRKLNMYMRQRLRYTDFSVVASNCIGGIVTHDLGIKFNSPTINLYFNAEDFIKFVENIEYYLSLELKFKKMNSLNYREYPICSLGDITLYCVHYNSYYECREQWERRKKRINMDKLFIVMTDRNGCTDELVNRLSKLPYKKVFFSHKPMPEYNFVIYVPGFEKDKQVGELHRWYGYSGKRYYEQYFDFVDWFNEE